MSKKKLVIMALAVLLGALAAFFWTKKVDPGMHIFTKADPIKKRERVDFVDIPIEKKVTNDPDERVRLALEKFKIEQGKIPEGAAAHQLADIKEKTEQLAKVDTPMPEITHETDEQGLKWRRLAYPSGEVRYELDQ